MSFRGQRPARRRRARDRDVGARRGRIAAIGSLILVAGVLGMIVLTSVTGAGSHRSTSTATASGGNAGSGKPGSGAVAQPGTASVPILVYHVINARPAQSTAP